MNCAYCSTSVPENATYCHHCGSMVSDADGQAAATAAIDQSSEERLEKLLKAETRGEFEIERMLGKGGMAIVYLANEIHLGRKVAIKVLPPELTFGHGVERFKREARTAAALDHPHIIPIHRIASGGTLFWYTMKYVEGRSLEQYLKEKPRLSLEETVRILEPVAQALEYAHQHQVIHRDVKPANVMIDLNDRVVMTDFGIAKALTEGTLTASGSVIGTPFYMSPEQGMGKPVTGAADQYSVAVMAYRMLSGQVPFEGDSAIDILHKHCKEIPPPLEVLRPDLPSYVYAAVDKALAKPPNDRFSSVSMLVDGLKRLSPEVSAEMPTAVVDSDPSIQDRISTEVIDRVETPTRPQPAAPVERPRKATAKSRRGLLLIPIALGAIAIGVLAGTWINSQRAAPEITEQPPAQEQPVETVADPATTQPEEPVIPEPPLVTTGTITVTGLPNGGFVTANGQRQSDSTFELDPGSYAIVMSAPGFDEVETQLEVSAGLRLALRFPRSTVAVRTGTVSVSGLPEGGAITVDGRRQRGTSFELDPGSHTIQMSAPGFHSFETDLQVSAGTGISLEFAGQAMVAAATISPARPALETGGQVTLRIRPVDADGNVLSGRAARWESQDRSIASVTQAGLVTGVGSGTTTIAATVEGQTARAQITVTPAAVASVSVNPRAPSLEVGGTVRLTAAVSDSRGQPLSSRPVAWQSGNPSVATVSAEGVVRAVGPGSANIVARSGGQSASAAITVKAAAAPTRPTLRQPTVADRKPAEPTRDLTWSPDRLLSAPLPDGWSQVSSAAGVLATYSHRRRGTIRIVDLRDNPLGDSREAMLVALRQRLERSLSSIREVERPFRFVTDRGDTLLVRQLVGLTGSGIMQTRQSVIVAASRNRARALGVLGTFEYIAREEAKQDLLQILKSLN